MTPELYVAAILLHEGQIGLRFEDEEGWALPDRRVPEGVDDLDNSLEQALSGYGVTARNLTNDFLDTVYFEHEGQRTVYNVYAPRDFDLTDASDLAWVEPAALERLPMVEDIREFLLVQFGLREAPDDEGAGARRVAEALHEEVSEPAATAAYEQPQPAETVAQAFNPETLQQSVQAGDITLPPLPAWEETPAPSSASGTDSRRERGLEVLGRLFAGDPQTAYAAMSSRFPKDFGDLIVDFALGDVWSRPGLDRKTRSFCVISALTALGHLGPLRGHVNGALNHGATRDEVVEVIIQMAAYAGFPAAVSAMEVVQDVFRAQDEQKAQG
jgi:4-carboxymuconolactone decarboxylase